MVDWDDKVDWVRNCAQKSKICMLYWAQKQTIDNLIIPTHHSKQLFFLKSLDECFQISIWMQVQALAKPLPPFFDAVDGNAQRASNFLTVKPKFNQ